MSEVRGSVELALRDTTEQPVYKLEHTNVYYKYRMNW